MTSEDQAKSYFENLRWPEGVISPFDRFSQVYICNEKYKCKNSGKYFNVKTGTILHGSRLSLKTWYELLKWIQLGNSDPRKLSEAFNISLKTSYAILKKIHFDPQSIEVKSLSDWLTALK